MLNDGKCAGLAEKNNGSLKIIRTVYSCVLALELDQQYF